MLQATTLRPGLLVSLKTSVRGNVSYKTTDLQPLTNVEGEVYTRWETEKHIADAAEHELAVQTRAKCRSLIVGCCANSAFGLLCPESKADQLELAIADARKLAEEFNAKASITRVTVNVIAGKVNPNDAEAIRAINGELRDLIDGMAEGVRNLNAEGIRAAATKAKSLGSMLSPTAQVRIQDAIDAARSAARKIVSAGEQAAIAVDHEAVKALREARTAFLDIDTPEAAFVAPEAQARAIDLGEDDREISAQVQQPLPFEMGD